MHEVKFRIMLIGLNVKIGNNYDDIESCGLKISPTCDSCILLRLYNNILGILLAIRVTLML